MAEESNFVFNGGRAQESAPARTAEMETRMTMHPDVALDTLLPGTTGVISDVPGAGPIDRRLLDLGLLPGTSILVLRRAPLGDPTEFELRGYRLCLRRSEAARVRVAVNGANGSVR